MKKVLIVDFNATAPTYNHYFVKGLNDEGVQVDILGIENKTFTSYHREKLNYKGFKLGKKSINYILNWLWLLITAKKYKAIHFQWLQLLKHNSLELLFVRILKQRNKKIFYTVHNFFPHDSDDEKVNKRYVRLYRMLDILVVHANSTTAKINSIAGLKDIVKINHGYFYTEFADFQKSTYSFELLMFGSILAYKGVEDAIEVVALLQGLNISIKLLVAGKCEPHYLQTLKDLIRDKDLESVVVLNIGFIEVEQLIKHYKNAALSIMPYKEIEQSGVLYTSLGLGVPVVGYDVGGFGETIINEHNGYLVPKNDVAALAQAVRKGLQNRLKLRENILQDIQNDLWVQNAKTLKEEYYK